MAKTDNLTDFLTNTADAIRTAEGSTNAINPQDFEIKITALKLSVQTADANATAADILANKTAYANGQKLYGSLPNKGEANIELTDLTTKTVERGYYSGGTAKIADAESAKIIPENIKSGVTVLGVEGTLESGPSASYSESVNDGGGLTATITM